MTQEKELTRTISVDPARLPELMTVDQVAEVLGVHPRTVWRHIKDGNLKAVRLGKKLVYVRRDDLLSSMQAYNPNAEQ